jgi:FAD/FMN-containing dehydrogenase
MSPTARDAIAGDVIVPGDDAYDDARQVYNLLHDARPALIVRPRTAADVARALELARQDGHEVAVKSGGHSIAGFGTTDGGLLIDLTAMNAIHVDRSRRRAVVGGGVRAGAFTAETYGHGQIVPFGDSPDVGVSGITLGGGIGWLSRKLGLTLDSLEGAEVVLADGQVVTADDDQHPDLFWALRGGGGNFGVVTRMRFRLHPLGPVVGGVLALPATPDVVRGVLDRADAAPDDLGTISLVTRMPPLPFVPEEAHGRPAVMITLVWSGEPAEGRRRIDALRQLAPPLVDDVVLRPYPEMYDLFADVPPSVTNATTTLLAHEVTDLDDVGAQAILDAIEEPPEPDAPVLSGVELRVLGGAIARVADGATAFGLRGRKLAASIVAAGFEPDRADVHRAWVAALADRLAPMSKGAYLNFVDTDDEHRLDDVYPPATRERLVTVKARYDPDNVFHRNLTIPPAS